MTDLIANLRKAHADWVEMDEGGECAGARFMREAADEIASLRNALENIATGRAKDPWQCAKDALDRLSGNQ